MIFPERFLSREAQFCTICHAQGKGWMRITNEADMIELRQGRTERAARAVYRARRRRRVMRHLEFAHPEVIR